MAKRAIFITYISVNVCKEIFGDPWNTRGLKEKTIIVSFIYILFALSRFYVEYTLLDRMFICFNDMKFI